MEIPRGRAALRLMFASIAALRRFLGRPTRPPSE